MAEQRNGKPFEELTPDQCIDFAAGLLDREGREEVLRLAAASPEAEELLRSVIAQAETARSAADRQAGQPAAAAPRVPARGALISGVAGRVGRFVDSMFGPGRLVPAMAGASLLILGLAAGAGTMHLLQPGGGGAGTPARLISLFPSATRTAGAVAAVSAGTGLYIELNGLEIFPCETPLRYDLAGPSGRTLLEGRLDCQPETGEWAGLFLPDRLLTAAGTYRLSLVPAPGGGRPGEESLVFNFDIR